MNLTEFKSTLSANPDRPLAFVFPDGGFIPRHFHVTEVGHVSRNFIDCGGTRRRTESCLLQAWVADDVDHRLDTTKLAGIFVHAHEVLPHEDLSVEIEYEHDVVSQFPVVSSSVEDGTLVFHLGLKHTDCLARELCLPDGGGCCTPEKSCC